MAPGGVTDLVSRAYHDSTFMAQVAPTGMLFIPCWKGYSHRPDEYASPEDMAMGIQALALAMVDLAQASSEPAGSAAVQDEL